MLVEIMDEGVNRVVPNEYDEDGNEKRIPITMIAEFDETLRESYHTVRDFIFNTFTTYDITTPHTLTIEYRKRDPKDSMITCPDWDAPDERDFYFNMDILDINGYNFKGNITLDDCDNVIFYKRINESASKNKCSSTKSKKSFTKTLVDDHQTTTVDNSKMKINGLGVIADAKSGTIIADNNISVSKQK